MAANPVKMGLYRGIIRFHPLYAFSPPFTKIAKAKSNCIIEYVASQKSYVPDHLTKKERPNKGVLPMYYAEGTHPAIIDRDTFDRAQRQLEANRLNNNVSMDTPARYPFSGMIQCDNCGRKFKRVVSCDDGHYEKVDGQAAGLERDSRSDGSVLYRQA